jgi:hypothetical protein
MKQENFKAIWDQLFEESMELETRRANLENDLNEVRIKIENVEQALNYIRPLAGIPTGKSLAGLGMTDAIRAVLRESKQRMAAGDVRKALENGRFDLSGLSSPMSSIYTVLGRLADDSQEATREKDENGNGVFYSWKSSTATFDQRPPAADPDDYAQSAEISDDDIPF